MVVATTWLRESNGLFDYNSRNLLKQTFRIDSSVQILRKGTNCLAIKDQTAISDCEQLVQIQQEAGSSHPGRYRVTEATMGTPLWQVVKHSQSLLLKDGDLIKCGKVMLRVKRIAVWAGSVVHSPKAVMEKTATGLSDFAETSTKQCRVCLSDLSSASNPFLSPCHCTGSLASIHLYCLREWLHSKMKTRQTASVVSYNWQVPVCELCKGTLPERTEVEGVGYEVMEYYREKQAYIILEEGDSAEGQFGRLVHVGSLEEGQSFSLVQHS